MNLGDTNKMDKFRGTVRAKYDNARTLMSKSIKVKPSDDEDFVSLAEKYTVDKDKQKERIARREDKLRQLSNSLQKDGSFKESKDEEQNNNNNNNNNSSSNSNTSSSSSNNGSNTVVANSEIPRPHGFNK